MQKQLTCLFSLEAVVCGPDLGVGALRRRSKDGSETEEYPLLTEEEQNGGLPFPIQQRLSAFRILMDSGRNEFCVTFASKVLPISPLEHSISSQSSSLLTTTFG